MLMRTYKANGSALEFLFRCPICWEDAWLAKRGYRFGPYQLCRCANPSCRSDFLNPRAPEAVLRAQYDSQEYYEAEDGQHGYFDYEAEEVAIKATATKRLRRLDQAMGLQHRGKVLEIGGGLGFASLAAMAMGYTPTLVEASQFARAYARLRAIAAIPPEALRHVESESYDMVMAWDSLEHIYNLHETIAEIHRILRPGGIFFFNMPDTTSKSAQLLGRHWWAYREPEHIFYLPIGAVHIMLAGKFQIHASWPDKQYMTLGGAALRFGRMMPRWLAPTMGRITHGVLRLLHLDSLVIPIPHGLRVYVAVKT